MASLETVCNPKVTGDLQNLMDSTANAAGHQNRSFTGQSFLLS